MVSDGNEGPSVSEFESLDPYIRTTALVGTFLQTWAFIESKINNLVRSLLKLDLLDSSILCVNIQLRDKIHICRTAAQMLTFLEDEERASANKTLLAVSDRSAVRNMMAHDLFYPSEDGSSVEFYVVRAKGKLSFPKDVWTVQRFIDEFNKNLNQADEVEAIIGLVSLSASRSFLLEKAPHDRAEQTAYGGLRNLLAQSNLDYLPHPTNPETDDETPHNPSKAS